jgi:hypothetical protein
VRWMVAHTLPLGPEPMQLPLVLSPGAKSWDTPLEHRFVGAVLLVSIERLGKFGASRKHRKGYTTEKKTSGSISSHPNAGWAHRQRIPAETINTLPPSI